MKYLAIGPGGVFFFVILGHVFRLYKDGMLDDLQEISGASAGSIVAFTWSLGKESIFDYIFSQDIEFKTNPLLLVKRFGLVDITKFREKFVHLCETLFQFSDITFKEHFERTGIVLHVSAYSLDKFETVYYSIHNAPHMSVIDAITMSCSIPLYFTPFKNHIDGGLIDMVPVNPYMCYSSQDTYAISMDKTYPKNHKSIGKYIYTLICIILNNRAQHSTCKHISLHVPHDIIPVSFNISKSERSKLFAIGFNSSPLKIYEP